MYAELLLQLRPLFDNIQFIGEGVTSRVFRARERKTGSVVALKVLNPHLATDSISLERFRREIRITRSIQHPRIIAIYDLVTETEPYYLVMEFVDGLSLKDYIRLHSPVPVEKVIAIMAQLFDALASCHAKNVIHRDLKPHNVMITVDGTIKILDFGIARMTALTDLTQTGTSLGSPEYMAPELFATNVYEPRSDLYAVGVMAFELLTGDLPYQGDTLAVLFHRHLTEQVPELARLRLDIPAWLQQLIEKLLAKKPHLRYQSAHDVITDLKAQLVLSCAVPAVQKRICLACGEQTPADAIVCFVCGDDGTGLYRNGSYYIVCESQLDPEKLNEFLRDCFNKDSDCPGKRGTIFLSGVDEISVVAFKKAAQRYGIYVAGKETFIRNIGRIVTLLIGLPFVFFTVLFIVSAVASSIALASSTAQTYLKIAVALAVVAGVLRLKDFSFTFFRKPLLDKDDLKESKLAGSEWLIRLSPFLKQKRNDAMQNLISQTLERFLLLEKHAKRSGRTIINQLQKLVGIILPVANYLSLMEPAGKGDELAGLLREHARRTRTSEDVASLEETIRDIFSAEDNYALLVNRFNGALALFNRLIGMAIVFDMKIEQPQLDVVSGQIRELADEIEVWKRVKGELAGGRRAPL